MPGIRRTPPNPRKASPATIPAGTQATITRTSGWASPPASCCNGSAPATLGPIASAENDLTAYRIPTAAGTVMTVKIHATVTRSALTVATI